MSEPFFDQAAVARERYVAFFRRVVAETKSVEPSFAVELLVQPNGRASPPPFCLLRVDLVLGSASAPRVQRVAEPPDGDPPRSFRLACGLEIRRTSFSWEALRIAFRVPDFRIGALEGWLRLWLDPDEVRQPDASGLSGVVHELAWSYLELDRWQLDVDLGSAPLLALEELMDALHDAGVSRIDVSRRDAGGGDP